MLIQEYRIMKENGTSTDGFFVDRLLVGLLLGAVLTSIFSLFIMLAVVDVKEKEILQIKHNNYLIPKSQSLGTYIQMPDGKLYKKQ